jgi:hypothetical protein
MVPHETQTYGETTDPEPKEVAKCLLHSFPANIEHCLQVSAGCVVSLHRLRLTHPRARLLPAVSFASFAG